MNWNIASLIGGLLVCVCGSVWGQNVVGEGVGEKTVPPIELSLTQVESWLNKIPAFGGQIVDPEARRVADKLNAHVAALVDGSPWMPFQHTLGISGYETYFDHPDELFYTLSIALPYLPDKTRQRTKGFLAEQLESHPPYATEGYDWRTGRAREQYTVPKSLRRQGKGEARSVFGVYAFWAYCHYAREPEAARDHWPKIQSRVRPLVERSYEFDVRRQDYTHDEAEILNGDLAGLIGAERLARMNGETGFAELALARVRELLDLRINLGRVNARIVRRTHSSTKHLHVYKLPRFVQLTPEVGRALAQWTEGCETVRLRSYREKGPGWYMAFGDRLIGGENYTNPPHFSRALFSGGALIEQMPADRLFRWIDVPWCHGDLYFVEKCVYALWANESGDWSVLED